MKGYWRFVLSINGVVKEYLFDRRVNNIRFSEDEKWLYCEHVTYYKNGQEAFPKEGETVDTKVVKSITLLNALNIIYVEWMEEEDQNDEQE